MLAGEFFREIFGSASGYVCIAMIRRKPGGDKNKDYQETFYQYPQQLSEMHEAIEKSKYDRDIYFCAQLLTKPHRNKTNIANCTCAWSDLDTCHPDRLLVRPTIALCTSPGRFQAFWCFEEPQAPDVGEDISRRIAYRHADDGADRSGWDLSQLLRVPGTRNFKYGEGPLAPAVEVVIQNNNKYRPDEFAAYPQAEGYEYTTIPMPTMLIEDGIKILERNSTRISGAAFTLFSQEVKEGERSQALFRLEMLCAEAGLQPEETFQICRDAACNKWKDEPELLWRDVCRAYAVHKDTLSLQQVRREDVRFVTDEERQAIQANPTFVERYVEWGKTIGDAAHQYHKGAAFIALSAALSGSIYLQVKFGKIVPNLWLMILADTTLTRKSTAMNAVMDIVNEVDEALLMATDGSLEGFTTALSERSGRTSIFLKDEFTGLLESMMKKDYMAGMPEFFTALYDGSTQIRRLRKEEIKIKSPRLIIFAGGIKSRMQQLVTFEQVSSGFLPRFIFITAETDITKIKPLSFETEEEDTDEGMRDSVRAELADIYQHYKSRTKVPMVMDGKVVGVNNSMLRVRVSPDAGRRFNQIEQTLMEVGDKSGTMKPIMMPLYARLSVSMLKAAMLIAASRTRDDQVIVQEEDIVRAAYYGEEWRAYAEEVVVDVGKGPLEHKIQLIANAIHAKKRVVRSKIMQTYHLTAQEMTQIARTLEERGLITVTVRGKEQIFQSSLTEAERKLND